MGAKIRKNTVCQPRGTGEASRFITDSLPALRQALLLQIYHITVIGYHYPTLILLGSLTGIALAAGVEVVVFGVVEYQMPCSEFVGHASGIERRAVALLVCRSYAEGADWLMSEAFCLYADRDRYHPYEKSHRP